MVAVVTAAAAVIVAIEVVVAVMMIIDHILSSYLFFDRLSTEKSNGKLQVNKLFQTLKSKICFTERRNFLSKLFLCLNFFIYL